MPIPGLASVGVNVTSLKPLAAALDAFDITIPEQVRAGDLMLLHEDVQKLTEQARYPGWTLLATEFDILSKSGMGALTKIADNMDSGRVYTGSAGGLSNISLITFRGSNKLIGFDASAGSSRPIIPCANLPGPVLVFAAVGGTSPTPATLTYRGQALPTIVRSFLFAYIFDRKPTDNVFVTVGSALTAYMSGYIRCF